MHEGMVPASPVTIQTVFTVEVVAQSGLTCGGVHQERFEEASSIEFIKSREEAPQA